MTESNEGSRNPLLDEVVEKRRVHESQVRAQEMLPEFKLRLGEIISTYVFQEVETVVITKENINHLSNARFRHNDWENDRQLKTKLRITFPFNGQLTVVVISASGYPEAGNIESAQGFDFEIEVEELDEKLIIDGSKVMVQSKEQESEPYTRNTRMGERLDHWPACSNDALAEELFAYQNSIEYGLKSEGVRIEGQTPTKIIEDWRQYREGLSAKRSKSKKGK